MNRPPWTMALLLAAGSLVAACDDDPTGVDPRDVTFAPELGIELDAMTRAKGGLYLQDVQVGTGDVASAGKLASVYYRGWLPDGTQFDSRQDPDDPFMFLIGIGMVIQGWDQGVVGMRVGGVRKLVIPSSLGYGNQAVGQVPRNSVLVFEVNLLALE